MRVAKSKPDRQECLSYFIPLDALATKTDTSSFASKTLDFTDLRDPSIAPAYAALRKFALHLGAKNVPFAVNGILKRRFWVRRHKMWEYARCVACVMQKKNARHGAPPRGTAVELASGEIKERRKFRVLDFGGAATLPIFYLAEHDCEVWCLDIDATLANWSNRVSWKRGWRLRALTHDLTREAAPTDWGKFDAVISCSVLEHIPKDRQTHIFRELAHLLKPGGLLLFSFDFGKDAPVQDAVRDEHEVQKLVKASGLELLAGGAPQDSGQRFALDRRHPGKKFTFASLFLKKPAVRM